MGIRFGWSESEVRERLSGVELARLMAYDKIKAEKESPG